MKKKDVLLGWLLPIVLFVLAAVGLMREAWRPFLTQAMGLVIILSAAWAVLRFVRRFNDETFGGRTLKILQLIWCLYALCLMGVTIVGMFSIFAWLAFFIGGAVLMVAVLVQKME